MADIRESNGQSWTDGLGGRIAGHDMASLYQHQNQFKPAPVVELDQYAIRDLITCLKNRGRLIGVADDGGLYWQAGQYDSSYKGYSIDQIKSLQQWNDLASLATACKTQAVVDFFAQ